ncbi:MAG: hypothetical protein U0228_25190 [Myxococcaceae bacterium]
MIEALVYASVAAIVIGALAAQAVRRRRVEKQAIIEAPVAQRRLIVTSLLAGLGVVALLFAVMAVSIEGYSFAAGSGTIALALFGSLFFTRKPQAVVTFDSTARTLMSVTGPNTVKVDLAKPFRMNQWLWRPALRRGDQFVIVSVEQEQSLITFCFPWSFKDLTATPKETTTGALPFVLLDWRGSIIFERLRQAQSAATAAP